MERSTLSQVLRHEHEATIIRQAELIRQWPIGRERMVQAEIHARRALWEQQFGRIAEDTQQQVYSILSFVMSSDAALANEPKPLAELERDAAYEAAYFQQLERQTCPECGDGICPVEDGLN